MPVENQSDAQIVTSAKTTADTPAHVQAQRTPDGVMLSLMTPMSPSYGVMGGYHKERAELTAEDALAIGQWLVASFGPQNLG